MANLIYIFNAVITSIFDVLYKPLSILGTLGSLIIFSVLTGLAMLWVFGLISDQEGIKLVKSKIHGNLIAVRLFQNDLSVFLRIQGRIFYNLGHYIKYSTKPVLVLIIPVMIILIQLNWRYSIASAQLGKPILLEVSVLDASLLTPSKKIELSAGNNIVIETPGVVVAEKGEISWRIRPTAAGVHTIRITHSNQVVEKQLIVGPTARMINAIRTGASNLDLLLNPGEPPISKDTAIKCIEIHYPANSINVFGWEVHWLPVFFILSICVGYVCKGFFSVHI